MPPILVINLDRDAARLAHMRAQFAATGLSFTRFAAIDGAHVPDHIGTYFARCAPGGLRAGEIGCYASHLWLYRQIAAGALASPTLILEDDVGVPADLAAFMRALLGALPAGWDFVRLANPPKRAYLPVARIDARSWLIRYSAPPPGLGATLVSRSGARKFLEAHPRRYPIDQDLRRTWAWGLNAYGVWPAPFAHNVLATSRIEAEPLAARERLARQGLLRSLRLREAGARWREGAAIFGLGRWLACQGANAGIALIPVGRRAGMLNRLGQALAGRVKGGAYADLAERVAVGLDPHARMAYPPRSRAAP